MRWMGVLIVLLVGCGGGSDADDAATDVGINDAAAEAALECTAFIPPEGIREMPYKTVLEDFDLNAPSGNRLYGLITRPDPTVHTGLCFPAVVKVPGGINPGRMEALTPEVRMMAEAGMVVVTFNAEGRVDTKTTDDKQSEGDEDFNGFRHQDGLAEIIRFTRGLPYVLPDNVGVRTQSYGITMVAGCLARYPDLSVKYLVDGEGPSESFVTCHGSRFLAGDMQKYETVKGIFPALALWQDDSPPNQEWWSEREAIRFIGQFRGRYLRLQATWDHNQPPDGAEDIEKFNHPAGWPGGGPAWYHNKHTNDMVNAAVHGGVPWVRVNLAEHENDVNPAYDAGDSPAYLPGQLSDAPWAAKSVLEMARMEALTTSE